jgi:hypothetical protein
MDYQSNSNSASTASNGTANTVAITRLNRRTPENPERQQQKQQPQTAKEVLCRCWLLRPQPSCYRGSGRSGRGAKWARRN